MESTETSAGPGMSTSVTWSQNSPILQHGGISGMAYPWGNTTFPSGVAQFPSQMWSKQGSSAARLPIPALPGHLQLPPLAPGTAPVAAAATGFDQLIGAAGTSWYLGSWFVPNRGGVSGSPDSTTAESPAPESKGKRAKDWLHPDFYLPHDKKYDDVTHQELMFSMLSVAECLARYNIPHMPVLSYLEHLKFVAMKGMTASFSPESLARYEYLVTSKVVAGLFPVNIPADHEGVYMHLSAENMVPRQSSTPGSLSRNVRHPLRSCNVRYQAFFIKM